MNEILLLPAAIFFLIIGLYNLYQIRKKSESYIPVIAAFMMLIIILVMLFNPLLGTFALFLSMLVMASRWPAIKRFQEKRILEAFNKNNYSEELKIRDIFIGTKIWGKFALEHGARNAALIYSLTMGIVVFLALYAMYLLNVSLKLSFIVGFPTGYLVLSYYQMHGYFKKFLIMHAENTGKIK